MRWTSGARRLRHARIALGVSLLVAVATTARAADSPTDAERLFDRARIDMKGGHFDSAREKLLESLLLETTVGTLFNLGLCEEKLGRIRDALEHVRAAREQSGDDDKRRAIMTTVIDSLEHRVARVILRSAKGTGPALQLTLDGRPVTASAAGDEVLVDPGEHDLLVRGPGGPPRTTTIQVSEGETVVNEVVWQPAANAKAPPEPLGGPIVDAPAALDHRRFQRRLGAIAVNVGGAAIIAGGVLGFMTFGSKISADHHCPGAGCDEEGRRASAEGASYSTASTLLTIGGLASLGVGSYALLQGAPTGAGATRRERRFGYVAGAVGASALVASVVASGVALSAKRELLARCGDVGPCGDSRGLDAAARGQTAGTVATVALGVGVAGLGVASYALLVRPSFASTAEVRVTLSPGAVGLAGVF